jgi:hypothetical protein
MGPEKALKRGLVPAAEEKLFAGNFGVRGLANSGAFDLEPGVLPTS